MARFMTELSEMQNEAGVLAGISRELNRKQQSLSAFEVLTKSGSRRGRADIMNARKKLTDCAKKIGNMSETLQTVSGMYKRAENKVTTSGYGWSALIDSFMADNVIDLNLPGVSELLEHAQKIGYAFSPLIPSGLGATIMEWAKEKVEEGQKYEDKVGATFDQVGASFESGTSFGISKPKGILGYAFGGMASAENEWKSFGTKDLDREKKDLLGLNWEYERDPKTGEWEKKEEKDKQDKDKKDKKFGDYAKNITLAEFTYSFLDENQKGTVLGQTKDGDTITLNKKDVYIKHKVTAGGLESSLGAQYSLLSFEKAEQHLIGDDMLGIHTSGSVDFLSVSAAAKVGIGLWGEDGKFDPNLYAGFNAEAVAMKVSAQGGIDFLGADVNVKGSVGVGLGFHANVGINDGVLKLDFGGYLGIGGDVSLELDLSGAIETAGKVVDYVSDAAGQVADAIGDGLEAAGEFIGDVGNAIANGFKWLKFW